MTQSNASRPSRALVVDDAPSNRALLRFMLAQEGYSADEACDQAEARAALARGTYDLVVLDVCLGPGPDGLALLDEIRQASAHEATPVVLVSATADDAETVARGLRAGADDFITRDVTREVFAARVAAARRSRERYLVVRDDLDRRTAEAEASRRELEEAADLQRASLPTVPARLIGANVTGAVVPSVFVSGDLFDFFTDRQGRVCVVLIDVAGHGAAAALVAATSRATLRRALVRGAAIDDAVADLYAELALQGDPLSAAVALAILRYDDAEGRVEVLNAGLPPVEFLWPGERVEHHASTAPPVGFAEHIRYTPTTVALAARVLCTLCTDGLTGHDQTADGVRALTRAWALDAAGFPAAQRSGAEVEGMIRALAPAHAGTLHDDATLVLAALGR